MMCSESMKVVSRGKREQLGVCVTFSSSLWIMHALPSVSFFILTQTQTHNTRNAVALTRAHKRTHTNRHAHTLLHSSQDITRMATQTHMHTHARARAHTHTHTHTHRDRKRQRER